MVRSIGEVLLRSLGQGATRKCFYYRGGMGMAKCDGFDDRGDMNFEMEQLGSERTKNVLILMSDTGGGHRASAEAIRDAFGIEYGDMYKVTILISFDCSIYVRTMYTI